MMLKIQIFQNLWVHLADIFAFFLRKQILTFQYNLHDISSPSFRQKKKEMKCIQLKFLPRVLCINQAIYTIMD